MIFGEVPQIAKASYKMRIRNLLLDKSIMVWQRACLLQLVCKESGRWGGWGGGGMARGVDVPPILEIQADYYPHNTETGAGISCSHPPSQPGNDNTQAVLHPDLLFKDSTFLQIEKQWTRLYEKVDYKESTTCSAKTYM
jgi:hypothetical protein